MDEMSCEFHVIGMYLQSVNASPITASNSQFPSWGELFVAHEIGSDALERYWAAVSFSRPNAMHI